MTNLQDCFDHMRKGQILGPFSKKTWVAPNEEKIRFSRPFVVPKQSEGCQNRWRAVIDGSPLSEYLEPELNKTTYAKHKQLCELLDRGLFVWKTDIAEGYKNIARDFEQLHLCGFVVDDRV